MAIVVCPVCSLVDSDGSDWLIVFGGEDEAIPLYEKLYKDICFVGRKRVSFL